MNIDDIECTLFSEVCYLKQILDTEGNTGAYIISYS